MPALPPPAHIVSLDACADQYLLALAARDQIAGVSYRAVASDSYFRQRAQGLPRVRPTLEAVLMARPDTVIRTWGGEPKLIAALQARGVKVVQIPEAEDFPQIGQRVGFVASALGHPEAGRAWITAMRQDLNGAKKFGPRGRALYLTSGGYTAGPGAFPDALLRAAGFENAATRPSYAPVSLESLIRKPPSRLIAAFFEAGSSPHWGPGQSETVQRLLRRPQTLRIPAWALACPAPYSATAALDLARQAKS